MTLSSRVLSTASPRDREATREDEQLQITKIDALKDHAETPTEHNGDEGHVVDISPKLYDAVLFDMDGVVTKTASVHMKAWKSIFDAYMKEKVGPNFEPFTKDDYLHYVDGKPREEGLLSFLEARKLVATDAKGKPSLPADEVNKLAQAKDDEFLRLIHTEGVEAYESTIVLIQALRAAGIKIGLVTASRNGHEILKTAHLTKLFDTVVTGIEASELNLRGKPNPDVFLEAARRLNVSPKRCIVVEDAEAGVQSGRAGHFKKVIGVARSGNRLGLRKHGASVVVNDLSEVHVSGVPSKKHSGFTMTDLDITQDNWTVTYDKYDAAHELQRESLCTLGNGKYFTRGSLLGGTNKDNHCPGMYVAGGYNTVHVRENGDDDSKDKFEREELVNLPNWLPLTLTIEENDNAESTEWSVDTCEVVSFSQTLNLKEGILIRDYRLRDRQKRETRFQERRFIHMRFSHLAGIELCITPLNWSGRAFIKTAIDGTVTNVGDSVEPELVREKHFDISDRVVDGELVLLKVTTTRTNLVVAQATCTRVYSGGECVKADREEIMEDRYVGQKIHVDCRQNETLKVHKIAGFCTSRDRGIYEPGASAREYASTAGDFDALVETHVKAWRSLWNRFDLVIETTEEHSKLIPSLLLHLSIFHVVQTASPHSVDIDTGIPARGWTGEGYQGHIFWDEIFVFPYINLRMPDITASLLKYRYRRLEQARKIAKSYGAQGACFPWQSASDGKERTPEYWWLDSKKEWVKDYTRIELHVNLAIAYNVWQYFQVGDDLDFMYSYGSEILIEIARFFATYAKLNESNGRYEIHGVIGPDEFHNGYPNFEKPGLNNNAYTNIVTSWLFCRVIDLLEKLPSDHSSHLKRRLEIQDDEIKLWKDMSKRMYVPVMKSGVIAQFDGYEDLEEFPGFKNGKIDLDVLKEELAKNNGYLNQYKVSKQADLLMLGYLFTQQELDQIIQHLGYNKELASLERMAQYYIPRTSNQSTLSRLALVWVMSRTHPDSNRKVSKSTSNGNSSGDTSTSSESADSQQKSYSEVFYAALGSDYYDVASRGTTKAGIHIGAMGGTADIVQRCYMGLSVHDGVLWLDPALPAELARIAFSVRFRGQIIRLDLNHGKLYIEASHSIMEPVLIGFQGRKFKMRPGDHRVFKIKERH